MRKQARFIVLISVLTFLFVGIIVLSGCQNKSEFTEVDSIHYEYNGNHLHGLGYDSKEKRVFLATHYGLFILKEQDGKWPLFQLGDSRDDYMGFVLHPSDANTMYASGHSPKMGNMGVIKSEDGGFTFSQIFSGLKDETVDFHSMTISSANPSILYGFFQGGLYRTTDGGNSWEVADANGLSKEGYSWGVPFLFADPHKENVVYAGTPEGLATSEDYGDNWVIIDNQQEFAAIGADPLNKDRLIAFKAGQGVVLSEDGGKTWEARNNGLNLGLQDLVFSFVFDQENPERIFLATMANQVFLTENSGKTWQKIL